MRNTLILLAVIIGLASCGETETTPDKEQHIGIKFEKFVSIDSMVTLAKKEKKPIFVDCYASWCGPCKMMAKDIFPDTFVGAYMNAHYLNFKIDAEKEGVEFAKKFDVRMYPTYVYLDENGELMHKSGGYMMREEFIQVAADAKDSTANLSGYLKKFETHKEDREFLKKYADVLYYAGMDYSGVVNQYLSLMTEEEYASPDAYDFFLNYLGDINAKETKHLLANKSKYEAVYGADELDNLLDHIATIHFRQNLRGMDATQLEEVVNFLQTNVKNGPVRAFDIEMYFHKRRKDWASYEKLALENLEKLYPNDAYEYNKVSWTFYEHIETKSSLLKAKEWMNTAIKSEPSYANMDTYAAIAYKVGDLNTARNAALKAIELGKAEKEDVSSTEKLLEKIDKKPNA